MYKGIILHTLAKVVFILSSYTIHFFLGKILDAETYGTVGTIITIINFGYLFLNNGVRQAVSKEISKKSFNTSDIVKKAIVIQLGIALIAMVVIWLVSAPLSISFGNASLTSYIRMTAAIIPFMGLYFVMLGIFNGLQQFTVETKILTVYPLLKLFIVPFVYFGDNAIFDVEVGFLVSAIIIFCLCAYKLCQIRVVADGTTKEKIDWRFFAKSSLNFSSIFVAASIIMNVDTLIVKMTQSNHSNVGYYTGAVNFAKVPYYLLNAIFLVMLPVITAYYNQGKIEKVRTAIKNIFVSISALVFPIVTIISASAHDLLILFYREEYAMAGSALMLLIFGTFFLGMTILVNMLIAAVSKNKFCFFMSLFMLGVEIVTCCLGSIFWSITGAALACLVTCFVAFILSIAFLYKKIGNVASSKMLINVLISTILSEAFHFVLQYIQVSNLIMLVVLYAGVYFIHLIVMMALKTFSLSDLRKD